MSPPGKRSSTCSAGPRPTSRNPVVRLSRPQTTLTGAHDRDSARESLGGDASECLVPLGWQDEATRLAHHLENAVGCLMAQQLNAVFHPLCSDETLEFSPHRALARMRRVMSGSSRHALRSVNTPFSGAKRPAKMAPLPAVGRMPGSGATKFGFTVMREGSRPASMKRLRANSLGAT